MTPNQFIEELTKAIPYLPMSTSFPYPLTIRNSHKLMALISLKCVYSNNKIIYVISNPLITHMSYNLYKLIPLPIRRQDDYYVFILPSTEYIAVSENKVHYVTFITIDKICINLDEERSICKHDNPLYTTHSRKICEIELLFQPSFIPETCEIKVTHILKEICLLQFLFFILNLLI